MQRASFDLQCDVAQLDAQMLQGNTAIWGIRGCGKQASYVWTEVGQGYVLNSKIDVTDPATCTEARALEGSADE